MQLAERVGLHRSSTARRHDGCLAEHRLPERPKAMANRHPVAARQAGGRR